MSSLSFTLRLRYQTGRNDYSSVVLSRMEPSCSALPSVSNKKALSARVSSSVGCDVNLFWCSWKLLVAWSMRMNLLIFVFFSSFFSPAYIDENSLTNLMYTLQNMNNALQCVLLLGCDIFCTASISFCVTDNSFGLNICPSYSTYSFKNKHFFSLIVSTVFCS